VREWEFIDHPIVLIVSIENMPSVIFFLSDSSKSEILGIDSHVSEFSIDGICSTNRVPSRFRPPHAAYASGIATFTNLFPRSNREPSKHWTLDLKLLGPWRRIGATGLIRRTD